jgi:hypothetical protein
VHHPPAVGEPDRLGDLLEHLHQPRQVVRRRRAGLEQLGQGGAVDELHGQERGAVGQFAEGVHRRDAGVRQLRRDLRLGDEPPGVRPRQQGLDGDFTVEGEVASGEHPPHAALGDHAGNGVPGDVREVGRRVGQPRAGGVAGSVHRGRVGGEGADGGVLATRLVGIGHATPPQSGVSMTGVRTGVEGRGWGLIPVLNTGGVGSQPVLGLPVRRSNRISSRRVNSSHRGVCAAREEESGGSGERCGRPPPRPHFPSLLRQRPGPRRRRNCGACRADGAVVPVLRPDAGGGIAFATPRGRRLR